MTASCVEQLRRATETSWVVSYDGKTIPRWRTAAKLKIDISPYLSEKSSDFNEILYTAADFELDERHVIKNKKVALERLPSSTERISCDKNFRLYSTETKPPKYNDSLYPSKQINYDSKQTNTFKMY